MEDLLKSSIVAGLIFSAFQKFGPQAVYTFPDCMEEKDIEKSQDRDDGILRLCQRDYIQISIKNLSLLIGDKAYSEEEDLEDLEYFAILPYPDFKVTSLTYFHFLKTTYKKKPLGTSFSICVDENKRSFLYNNINQLKELVTNFFKKLDREIADKFKPREEVEPYFKDLMLDLIKLEKKPYAPTTSQRKMKILFAGLDDSGKTSFLLAVDRKYSKLIGLKPTRGVNVNSIEALGATIFLWDLGGQISSRQKYLNKSQIYLYEADLLFFFIDIKNKKRFEEAFDYLQKILAILEGFEQETPVVYVLSKGDSDIVETDEIKENIKDISSKLVEISSGLVPEFFVTSIFSIFTVLRAFSSGISKLSPNRELINLNLKKFSIEIGVSLTLMLSVDGLVLADYYSKKEITQGKSPESGLFIPENGNLRDIFEITAPQFAILYKIFSKFRALQEDEALFKISNSIILFKKTQISDYPMFILFLMDREEKKDKINLLLPDFLDRTRDLLLRYIS